MKYLLIISWTVLFIYTTTNIIVGSYSVDKEAYEGKSTNEVEVVREERNKSIMRQAQNIFLPVWRMNRYIYSFLTLLCIITSFMYWKSKTHNKSFKSTPKSGAI